MEKIPASDKRIMRMQLILNLGILMVVLPIWFTVRPFPGLEGYPVFYPGAVALILGAIFSFIALINLTDEKKIVRIPIIPLGVFAILFMFPVVIEFTRELILPREGLFYNFLLFPFIILIIVLNLMAIYKVIKNWKNFS